MQENGNEELNLPETGEGEGIKIAWHEPRLVDLRARNTSGKGVYTTIESLTTGAGPS